MYFPTSKNAVDVPSNLFAFRAKLAHHSSLAPIPLKQCIESNATHTHISCKTKKKKRKRKHLYCGTNSQLPLQHPGDLDLHQDLGLPAREQY